MALRATDVAHCTRVCQRAEERGRLGSAAGGLLVGLLWSRCDILTPPPRTSLLSLPSRSVAGYLNEFITDMGKIMNRRDTHLTRAAQTKVRYMVSIVPGRCWTTRSGA